ncbi:MAG: nuclease-related domain-containing protein [Xanthomonadales bacterium]|nr:nuclease-related domain-containing protein [Xanthomonadales bacterium]
MELVIFVFILIAVLSTLAKSPLFKGKLGELRVSHLLQKHLAPTTYQVLNDVTLPSINGTTQIYPALFYGPVNHRNRGM